jgi:hypothetical protein
MYPPQYRLPPINPAAFGGLPQGPARGPSSAPPPAGGPQGGPPMDMNKYLLNKVMEIRQRMGSGDVGALSAFADAMPQPQMNVAAQQQPQPQQQPQQQARMA